jgi:CheY-like chemotaxis protein
LLIFIVFFQKQQGGTRFAYTHAVCNESIDGERIMSALRKVLVVDDDAVVGKSFNRVLSEKKGYVVTTVENAHEALEQMREQSFDVVFTDIKMPGMDGVELAERVKASQPWTPVVIITGYGTTENESRAKAAGVSDFVRKPLSPEMIEESAANALRPPVAAPVAQAVAAPSAQAQLEVVAEESRIKNVALFLAAPFIGLAYAVMLPLVGFAMLAWTAWKAMNANPAAARVLANVKNVVLFVAAPFIGLIYAVSLPFVGMVMLAGVGLKALRGNGQAA